MINAALRHSQQTLIKLAQARQEGNDGKAESPDVSKHLVNRNYNLE
jgi:hypothetical protein